MASPHFRTAIVLIMALSLRGCYTIAGACVGAVASVGVLAGSAAQLSSDNGDGAAAAALAILVAGPVIGAACGAAADLKALWDFFVGDLDDGWAWDSPEGRGLRRGVPYNPPPTQ